MQIADVMTQDARVARPDETVRDAARTMADLDIGVLPVREAHRLVGMVTDRDIVVRRSPGGAARIARCPM